MRNTGRVMLAGLSAFFFLSSGTAEASLVHTVASGDTIWKISQQYQSSVSEIVEENAIETPSLIMPGERLVVPILNSGSEKEKEDGSDVKHVVEEGETLWKISQEYDVPVAAIFAASDMTSPHRVYSGKELVIPGDESIGRGLSVSDLDIFASLIYAEAKGEPYKGQVAAAATVLNRMDSATYPDDLKEVVFQVVWVRGVAYYQYEPVQDGRIWLTPDNTAYRAVRDAMRGWDPSYGATGFYNPAKSTNQWVRQQPVTTVISNHVFFE